MNNIPKKEFYKFVVRQLTFVDTDTGEALPRIAKLAISFGQYLALSAAEIDVLEATAYLHDFGKLFVPLAVLKHPGKLNTHQWVLMRLHVIYSWRLIEGLSFLSYTPEIVLRHHERWDGSGYPDHLAGETIPYLARVFSIIDIWDALTHERAYKRAFSFDESFAILKQETENGKHDPDVFLAFSNFLKEIVNAS